MSYAETKGEQTLDRNLGGRPRHGSEVKKAPLNMRTDPELRDRIEAAAEARRLSLTQEVERRLRASFAIEEAGPEIEYLVHALVHSAALIQAKTGAKIAASRTGWEAMTFVSKACLNYLRPDEELPADRYRRELAEIALRQREVQDRVGEIEQRLRLQTERGDDTSLVTAEYNTASNELVDVMVRYGELRPLYDAARGELTEIQKQAAELAREALTTTRASAIATLRAPVPAGFKSEAS